MPASHLPILDTEIDADSWLTTGLLAKYRDNAAYAKTAWAVKAADETVNNSAVLQDDDDLFFTIVENEVWQYSFTIQASLRPASDLKIQLTHPGGAGYFSIRKYDLSAVANPIETVIHAVANAPVAVLAVAIPGDVSLQIDGNFAATATGVFKLQWAQNTAVVENTVFNQDYSFVIAHRVDWQ